MDITFSFALTITLAFLLVCIHNMMNLYFFHHDTLFPVVVDWSRSSQDGLYVLALPTKSFSDLP
jgi:hypothetical protein